MRRSWVSEHGCYCPYSHLFPNPHFSAAVTVAVPLTEGEVGRRLRIRKVTPPGYTFSKLRTIHPPPNSLALKLQWPLCSGGSSYASTVAASRLKRGRPMSADGNVRIVKPRTTWMRYVYLPGPLRSPLLTCYDTEWRNHRPSSRRRFLQRSLCTITRSAIVSSACDT